MIKWLEFIRHDIDSIPLSLHGRLCLSLEGREREAEIITWVCLVSALETNNADRGASFNFVQVGNDTAARVGSGGLSLYLYVLSISSFDRFFLISPIYATKT